MSKLTSFLLVSLMCFVLRTGTAYEKDIDSGFDSFSVSIFMMIAYCFVPAAWIAFIVREKETKCKHQQV